MAEVKLQPLGNRVLVAPQIEEDTIAGGLVVPPSANDEKRPEMGEILKLGTGKDEDGKAVSFNVKVGDKVYFKKYSPEELELEGEKYLILDAQDILAVVK